ncbi:MAG: MBOAT family protein [Archangiaceae bacterium]|nr:MBOAT family protein [Archangiaceae bacterium]
MPFHSATLLFAVAALAALHWLLPWQRARLVVILVGSLTIYAWRHPPSLLLLLASIAFNWGWGLLLERNRGKPLLLGIGIAANLASLVYFKYSAFLLAQLPGQWPQTSPWLPLGISFFTFQVIAYQVDVYRGELAAERSLLVFAVFKSFFAQLVAGPIVRGHDFLPQLRERRALDWGQLHGGLLLVVAGLFLKVSVADLLAQHVDHAWDELQQGSLATNSAWFAMYGYAAQLLADFCGYSTMAVGFGLLFGLVLPPNFLHPYGAPTLREFWRRWHVTLSNWLRDYLYIPLGGNRRHPELNRMVTMTLGGLWHGAGWNFVLWGALHGAWLALEQRLPRLPRALGVLVTFHVVALWWVPFRAPGFAAAARFVARLFAPPYVWKTSVATQFVVVTFAFLLLQRWWFSAFPLQQRERPLRFELPLAAAMVVWLLGYGSARLDFIYFVF